MVIDRSDKRLLRHSADKKRLYLLPRFPGSDKKSQLYKLSDFPHIFKLSKDNAFTLLCGFTTAKHDVLYRPFKKNLLRLFETGNLDKEKKLFSENEKNISISDPQKKLAPLSLSDLQAGFVIWLCAVLIANFILR